MHDSDDDPAAELKQQLEDAELLALDIYESQLRIITQLLRRVTDLESRTCADHGTVKDVQIDLTRKVSGRYTLQIEACCDAMSQEIGHALEVYLTDAGSVLD
jgi:hypothetical protein